MHERGSLHAVAVDKMMASPEEQEDVSLSDLTGTATVHTEPCLMWTHEAGRL